MRGGGAYSLKDESVTIVVRSVAWAFELSKPTSSSTSNPSNQLGPSIQIHESMTVLSDATTGSKLKQEVHIYLLL